MLLRVYECRVFLCSARDVGRSMALMRLASMILFCIVWLTPQKIAVKDKFVGVNFGETAL